MSRQFDNRVATIIEAIRQLSPAQRRQLQRRLKTGGLVPPEQFVSDQNRLEVAPAIGARRARRTRQAAATPQPVAPPPAASTPAEPEAEAPSYRSAVSGRVVIGSPENGESETNPHTMPPLPGQAPEQPIAIIFDGGSKGNPGRGYGSYAVQWPGQPQQLVQLQFGDRVTNNEAEYDTLIAALEATQLRLQDNGASLTSAALDIRGDSLLVVNQVSGEWKCKEPRLKVRRDRVRELLSTLGSWQLIHHDRSKSVEILGH